MHLSEKVGRRLRRKGFRGRTLSIRVRYQSFLSEGKRITFPHGIANGAMIYRHVRDLFVTMPLLGTVRLVGVTLSNLERGSTQPSLFEDRPSVKMENALAACDTINDRYGESIVRPGRLTDRATKKSDIPGLGFQKRFIVDDSSEED